MKKDTQKPKPSKEQLLEKEANTIKFYKKDKPFGYFSNFYEAPFAEGKKIYKTTQHYFQSKKFAGHPEEQTVVDAASPYQAFKLGRKKSFPKRKDWQHVKQDIMYDGLKLKFNTHKELKIKLMDTGDKKLIEHTTNDSYWADGGDGTGKNRLGVLLMKLRAEFKKEQSTK